APHAEGHGCGAPSSLERRRCRHRSRRRCPEQDHGAGHRDLLRCPHGAQTGNRTDEVQGSRHGSQGAGPQVGLEATSRLCAGGGQLEADRLGRRPVSRHLGGADAEDRGGHGQADRTCAASSDEAQEGGM
ncbi:unnamed protein product, partial [Closterium sp. NIES-53]